MQHQPKSGLGLWAGGGRRGCPRAASRWDWRVGDAARGPLCSAISLLCFSICLTECCDACPCAHVPTRVCVPLRCLEQEGLGSRATPVGAACSPGRLREIAELGVTVFLSEPQERGSGKEATELTAWDPQLPVPSSRDGLTYPPI